jgi:hypothetical protein
MAKTHVATEEISTFPHISPLHATLGVWQFASQAEATFAKARKDLYKQLVMM